jgi:hypothetical protein
VSSDEDGMSPIHVPFMFAGLHLTLGQDVHADGAEMTGEPSLRLPLGGRSSTASSRGIAGTRGA